MSSAIPRHLLPPEDDGYRTPTIEDLENDHAHRRAQVASVRDDESNIPPQLRSQLLADEAPRAPRRDDSSDVTDGKMKLNLNWKQRIKHFTWTFYLLTMATGGVANVIHSVPFRFTGLYAIGCAIFIFNIVLFILVTVGISLRFYFYPFKFRESFMHPTESLFIPASVVSFGTILMNISQYGVESTGPWLNTGVMILYWLECLLATVSSCVIYLILWSTQSFTIHRMTPVWIFPAYPLLIIGPHAGTLSLTQPQPHSLSIIVGGVILQGIGFMVAFTIYSAFIYRLMTQKLPKEALRPGMFVSVGPSGFTVTGLILMAANLTRSFPPSFMGDGALAAFVLKIVANWVGIWLWGLAVWFFIVSVGAHWSCLGHGGLHFSLTWFSFVFPNTALVTATLAVGKAFSTRALQIVGTAMAAVLVLVWACVFVCMLRAIVRKEVLWPQMGEDKDEGGFKGGDSDGDWKRRSSQAGEETKEKEKDKEGKERGEKMC
ncbi:MAG: hypothetical protein M1833_005578 [Piccolia ochrophora]|nr:MAG: hypothetical protein M1833_005578 [Piccolia ochrophora]